MSAMRPGAALFPLRLFLGLTFVYAGVQKLTDPGFLHPGAPTYIGTREASCCAPSPSRTHSWLGSAWRSPRS
jgi:thiosulfate dehydrogenase [quinone] large subunit